MRLPAILGMFAIVVYLGNLQKGVVIPGKTIIGTVFIYFILAGLDAINSQFATAMAMLILVAAIIKYGPSLLKGAGLNG